MWDTMQFCGVDMARRTSRRWLVALVYVALLTIWSSIWLLDARGSRWASIVLLYAVLATTFCIFGGYGMRGLIKPFCVNRPFGRPAWWNNDELDLQRRDRMHFYGYRVLMLMSVVLFVVTTVPDFALSPTAMRALVAFVLLVGYTLPSAMLLWSMPDVEREEAA